jgi:hypothetical protein
MIHGNRAALCTARKNAARRVRRTLHRAKQLGATIPATMIGRADEVIE